MVILQSIHKPNLLWCLQRTLADFIYNKSIRQKQLYPIQWKEQRKLWGYVAIAFNKVDTDRLAKVGPDRLCAEWILKNGGGVGFVGMSTRLFKNYNALPPESVKFNIQTIDASNASIMKIGFDHFIGCKYIETVILHNCKHLESGGLGGLVHLKETLKKLQISGCYNLRDSCLDVLSQLTKLEQLRLFDLIYIKDLQGIATKLRQALPDCKIEIRTS